MDPNPLLNLLKILPINIFTFISLRDKGESSETQAQHKKGNVIKVETYTAIYLKISARNLNLTHQSHGFGVAIAEL